MVDYHSAITLDHIPINEIPIIHRSEKKIKKGVGEVESVSICPGNYIIHHLEALTHSI